VELCPASFGGCFNVPSAEDDYEPIHGSTPETDKPDDALDDADYVRCIHVAVPSWTGCLHPVLKRYWSSNSVLRQWQATY
jgi:hypothetical protein